MLYHPQKWAGELNFVLAYTDERFQLSVQNSLALIILPVPFRVFGALLVARLYQRGGRYLDGFGRRSSCRPLSRRPSSL